MTGRVVLGAGIVTKIGDPAVMRLEARKMILAREIGARSGTFRVPILLDFDQASGTLVMERVRGLTGLRRVPGPGPRLGEFVEQAGIALAQAHMDLALPGDMDIPLPGAVAGPGPKVFLHGDYSLENVCVSDGGRGQLTLIDWSMTAMHGGYASFGTAYFDVVWFVNNLFSKPVYSYLSGTAPVSLARRFVKAYFNASRRRVDRDFLEYHRHFFDFKVASRMREYPLAKRALMVHGHREWQKFIKELEKGSF